MRGGCSGSGVGPDAADDGDHAEERLRDGEDLKQARARLEKTSARVVKTSARVLRDGEDLDLAVEDEVHQPRLRGQSRRVVDGKVRMLVW